MPTAAPRLRLVLASAAATLLGSALLTLVPGVSGTPLAVAATQAPPATASPAPSTPSPTPACNPPLCPIPTPASTTPPATAAPTATATATASPTASPTPRRTKAASRSPRPRSTYTDPPVSDAPPVTEVVPVGPASGALEDTPSATATPLPSARAAAKNTGFGDNLGRLVMYVLGAAVLLGLGGATGLYLTRHPHEH